MQACWAVSKFLKNSEKIEAWKGFESTSAKWTIKPAGNWSCGHIVRFWLNFSHFIHLFLTGDLTHHSINGIYRSRLTWTLQREPVLFDNRLHENILGFESERFTVPKKVIIGWHQVVHRHLGEHLKDNVTKGHSTREATPAGP